MLRALQSANEGTLHVRQTGGQAGETTLCCGEDPSVTEVKANNDTQRAIVEAADGEPDFRAEFAQLQSVQSESN